MATAKKRNVYRGLIVWMLVLLALAALAYAGYLYTQKDLERAVQQNAQEVEDINAARTAEYYAAVSEQNQQAAAAVQVDSQWPTPAAQGWDVLDLSSLPITPGSQVSVTREDMLKGGMLVINRWHAMPSDLRDDMMVSINRYSREDKDKTTNLPTVDASVMLMPTAVDALMSMYQDARGAGLDMDNIIIQYGYRTMEMQTQNWQSKADELSSRYSGDKLTEKVRDSGVAYPGTSDYQSGMSVGIYNWKKDDKEFTNTPLHETTQGHWIYDNSWKYGLVFRFPVQGFPYEDTVDKSYITGISRNMKVYRYVGVANAIVMHATGMCMEEYADYLIEHPHIAVFEDGQLRCEVYRLEGGFSDSMVMIPNGAQGYTVSSDNLGGMIVAVNY